MTQDTQTTQGTAANGASSNGRADAAAFIARLRAELAAQPDKNVQALLLHECATLEEATGEEPASARDYLAAFNADPQFREPLEALVRILSRRKSVKNLGKLLDALSRAAATPEEKARALYERASYFGTYEKNTKTAKELLEEAIAVQPEDPTLWLELEILAAHEGDAAGRMRALEARAEIATDPTWKALLFIELAELSAAGGDTARAYELLGAAAALEGKARFRTQLVLEQVAAREENLEALGRALESQADLIEEAMDDPARGDATGVPRYMRKPEYAADFYLRAAEIKRRGGDQSGGAGLLERAAERLPDSATISRARLVALEAGGDATAAAEIAKTQIERGAGGWSVASLWLRMAEAAALANDRAGALDALRKALESDPASIPARALEIDLLGDGQDPAALAGSFEATAESLASDGAKGRAFLLAAYVWGVLAGDVGAAKTALSQATACGVDPGVVSRVARTLASLRGDSAWYEEATKRLLAAGATEIEQSSLWFELGRSRVLRGDDAGAIEAFTKLAGGEEGPSAWLGRALAAYAVGLRAKADGAEPEKRSPEGLEALARAESNPEVARGLLAVAALRAARAGDIERARARLNEVHQAAPEDEVASVFLADLERRAGNPIGAARALAETAGASSDRDLRAALYLEAAMLLFRGGDRVAAIDAIEAARSVVPRSGAALLNWALRGADPDSLDGRRRALEAAADAGADSALLSLERFGLEASAGDPAEALAALETLEGCGTGDLGVAGFLARILWASDGGFAGQPVEGARMEQRGDVDRALVELQELGGDAASIALAERYRMARRVDQDVATAAARAADWAAVDANLYASVEWLAAAIVAEDHEAEVRARRSAAKYFTGGAQAAIEASAAFVAILDQPSAQHPFIQSDHVSAQLANLELAPPGCDPRRRAVALEGIGQALGSEAQLDALTLAGYSSLAAQRYDEARKHFRTVLELRPRDPSCWEGVRAASEALEDHVDEALACAQLGALCNDPGRGAMFWEHAGLVLAEHTDAADDAEIAFERAFDRDARRAVAFDKLFRAVRARNEDDRLLEIIAKRLEVSEDDREIGKLYWERARVLRKKGDLDAALAALENVTMLEPDHVGALALLGEVCITKGAFSEAAPFLARLSLVQEAPKQQRLMSGIAAVDLYENKLGDASKALEVLVGLHRAGLSNPAVRERLARVAARAGAWIEATSILEALMNERTTKEGRIEAARLAMAIWRFKLEDAPRAAPAASKLLEEAPDDAEAVDYVLVTNVDPVFRARALARAKATLIQGVAMDPTNGERVELLSRIANTENDLPLRQATLGALIALGKGGVSAAEELRRLDARTAAKPQIALDARALAEIADPQDGGPVSELFVVFAETISASLGPSLSSLGVTKKDKVEARGGHPLRFAIAEWVGAVGITSDWDLYVGGPDPRGAHAISGETPAIVIGSGITAPFDAQARSVIAREVFALRRGIASVRTRDDNTIASLVAAAQIEAGLSVPPPQLAVFAEIARAVKKEISRKAKKAIAESCQRIAQSGQDPRVWANAARRSLDRVAAIAAGDVSIVLADILGAPRDQVAALVPDNDRAKRILGFVLSPSYLELRGKLGMGVR